MLDPSVISTEISSCGAVRAKLARQIHTSFHLIRNSEASAAYDYSGEAVATVVVPTEWCFEGRTSHEIPYPVMALCRVPANLDPTF